MTLQDIPKIKHTDSNNFFLLCGPCAIEGEDMAYRIAEKVVSITDKLNIPYVFKGSFKKANRSRIDSFTGIGDDLFIVKEHGVIGVEGYFLLIWIFLLSLNKNKLIKPTKIRPIHAVIRFIIII